MTAADEKPNSEKVNVEEDVVKNEAAAQEDVTQGSEKIDKVEEAPAADPTAEWKAKVAYLSAEIENMRKRFAREKTDVIRFANESLIKTLLPVLDNLHLAVEAAKKQTEAHNLSENPLLSGLMKGVEMTVKHFEQTLEQIGVQKIPAVGQSFDPAVHEALSQASEPTAKENEVVSELQKGFSLNGRVLRTSKVIVNKLQN